MDYEFWFWLTVAFFAGKSIGNKTLFYIGSDREKYDAAWAGIQLKGALSGKGE